MLGSIEEGKFLRKISLRNLGTAIIWKYETQLGEQVGSGGLRQSNNSMRKGTVKSEKNPDT